MGAEWLAVSPVSGFDRSGSPDEKMVVPFYGNLFPDLRNMPDHYPATKEKNRLPGKSVICNRLNNKWL